MAIPKRTKKIVTKGQFERNRHYEDMQSPKNRFPHCVGRDYYEDCITDLNDINTYDNIPKTCKICPRFTRDTAARLLKEVKK